MTASRVVPRAAALGAAIMSCVLVASADPRPGAAPAAEPSRMGEVPTDLALADGAQIRIVSCTGDLGYTTIQAAINDAQLGDIVLVRPRNLFGRDCGDDAYVENLDFLGKVITVRSVDPTDPTIVAATIIDGSGAPPDAEFQSVVVFRRGEGPGSILDGFTITGGKGSLGSNPNFRTGGGIYCCGASPTIRRCVITDNHVSGWGGGIRCVYESSPTFESCQIERNTAGGGAGGACFWHSSIQLLNSSIVDNIATGRTGGLELESYSDATISNCRIERNTGGSSLSGGGISTSVSSPTIVNSLIAGNQAGTGAGVTFYGNSEPLLRNCTIANNIALEQGGGVAAGSSSRARIENCILWGNEAPAGPQVSIDWEIGSHARVDVAYSDIEGGADAIHVSPGNDLVVHDGLIDSDPLFRDPDDGDYHLATGSPVMNAADPDFFPEKTETDLDGQPRLQHCRVDMGAYEFAGFADCNGNAVADSCEIAHEDSVDCNENQVPDECDLASGESADMVPKGGDDIPDECQIPKVVASHPPDGSVDARQPSEPDGTGQNGWRSIELTMSGYPELIERIDSSYFAVESSAPAAPFIQDALVRGSTVTVMLSDRIPVGECTTVTYLPHAQLIRLRSLPGDVTGDEFADGYDYIVLINHLNDLVELQPWQCDIDRSGSCAPADLLRLIDLLNGANAYDPWVNTLGPPCP